MLTHLIHAPVALLAMVPVAVLAEEPQLLKEAKLNIEHNATDLDTGFQGFLDGEGWQTLTVTGPAGVIVRFDALGALRDKGLTELFFETVEPANADVPIDTTLGWLPEGDYRFDGVAADGAVVSGVALLSHAIPAGPVLTAPAEDAVVPMGPITVSWEPVTETITGASVEIVAYQLVIEKDAAPHPHMIGKFGLQMYLPPTTTSVELPAGVLEPGSAYAWEVLAIEASGNQTLSSSAFSVE